MELEAPLLRASLRREYASDLRNATISLQPHAPGAVPLSVRLPAAALRLAADGDGGDEGDDRGSGDDGGIDGATIVDVHLGSWGALGAVDLYGWRDGGGYAQSVVSNITTLALSAAAADGVHRDALRVRGSAAHPLEIIIPVPLPPPPPPPASVVVGESACYGWPTLLCNAHGVCEDGACACEVDYVDVNCTQQQSCQAWLPATASYSGAACRFVGAVGGGAVRCACDGDAIDFAVLQENKTARIPRRGCADPTADNYDGSVDIAYAAACTYTPPPPPPPPDYFIPFALTAFTGGWVLLSPRDGWVHHVAARPAAAPRPVGDAGAAAREASVAPVPPLVAPRPLE